MTDARNLTLGHGGRWYGPYGTMACPVCQSDRRRDQDALTVADGRAGVLLHCKRLGCDFRDIATAMGLMMGDFRPPDPAIIAAREAERLAELAKRARVARRLWGEAQPIGGTLAESYLQRRGITSALPGTLRFHPACWAPAMPPHRAGHYPAMLALVEGSDAFAIHRTWLFPDGDKAKQMLGATAGGAVRLSGGGNRLVVGEGIETCLALLCGLLAGPATVWAALSTSGLRSLRLPAQPGRLTVACDGDTAGRAAAMALAERAHALGWAVATIDPGNGADFNDILNRKDAA